MTATTLALAIHLGPLDVSELSTGAPCSGSSYLTYLPHPQSLYFGGQHRTKAFSWAGWLLTSRIKIWNKVMVDVDLVHWWLRGPSDAFVEIPLLRVILQVCYARQNGRDIFGP